MYLCIQFYVSAWWPIQAFFWLEWGSSAPGGCPTHREANVWAYYRSSIPGAALALATTPVQRHHKLPGLHPVFLTTVIPNPCDIHRLAEMFVAMPPGVSVGLLGVLFFSDGASGFTALFCVASLA